MSTTEAQDHSTDLLLPVGAVFVVATMAQLLDRAAAIATTLQDRQLVQLVAAQLAGDFDQVEVLAGEHLIDYPDDLLAAALVAAARRSSRHSLDDPTSSERTTA